MTLNTTKGCPSGPHRRCDDYCLSGALAGMATSIVGLLWQEAHEGVSPADRSQPVPGQTGAPDLILPPLRNPPQPPGSLATPWPHVLGTIYAAEVARWADRNAAAGEVIRALAARSAETAGAEESADAAQLLPRTRVATRQITSRTARRGAIDPLSPRLALPSDAREAVHAEGGYGLLAPRTLVPWRQVAFDEGPSAADIEVEVDHEGDRVAGRMSRSSLSLAPRLLLVDRSLSAANSPMLLDAAAAALRIEVVPRPLEVEQEEAELTPVTVSLPGLESEWTVGRESRRGFSCPSEVPPLLSTSTRREVQQATAMWRPTGNAHLLVSYAESHFREMAQPECFTPYAAQHLLSAWRDWLLTIQHVFATLLSRPGLTLSPLRPWLPGEAPFGACAASASVDGRISAEW